MSLIGSTVNTMKSRFLFICYNSITSLRSCLPSILLRHDLSCSGSQGVWGQKQGKTLDGASIHHRANAHKETDAFTFTPTACAT